MRVYQEQHYEDVARLVADIVRCRFSVPGGASAHEIGDHFANLFAADNPAYCSHCGQHEEGADSTACHSPSEEHDLEGGFDRERFLKACGLEPLPA